MEGKSFLQKLSDSYEDKGTLLCFGMDPVLERMRVDTSKNLADEIVRYFSTILEAVSDRISAVKPNVGYYLQFGLEGLNALGRLVTAARKRGLPVIVDLKAGDIGRTSAAYARFVFEELNGDSITLNPYMGYEAIEPFTKYGGRGFYILALTSNPSSADFQHQLLDSKKPLYKQVLYRICSWSEKHPSIGAVIGATQNDFAICIDTILQTGHAIPLLIPGVGAQGGSYREIRAILTGRDYPMGPVRINASSSISYAHEKHPDMSFEEAAILAVEELTGSP